MLSSTLNSSLFFKCTIWACKSTKVGHKKEAFEIQTQESDTKYGTLVMLEVMKVSCQLPFWEDH